MKTYEVTLPDALLVDNPIGTRADLVKVTHPAFAPQGKYYSRKHLHEAPAGSSHTHTIIVPVARRSGTNFNKPDSTSDGALAKRLTKVLQKHKSYKEFMDYKVPFDKELKYQAR